MVEEQQDTSKCEMREKYWNELNDSEKIERLREQVRKLREIIIKMSNTVYKLKKHSHDDKQILIPLSEDILLEERRYRNDDYF